MLSTLCALIPRVDAYRPRSACASASPRHRATRRPWRSGPRRALRASGSNDPSPCARPGMLSRSDENSATWRPEASVNNSATSSVAPAQKAATRQSKSSAKPAGSNSCGIAAGATRNSTAATTSPASPPTAASKRFSVANWRTRRRRSAPSTERIASSLPRAALRVSSRFAMFAKQISSTKPTTPRKSSDVRLQLGAEHDVAQRLAAPRRGLRSSRDIRARDPPRSCARSSRAASSETPGLSRATVCSQ